MSEDHSVAPVHNKKSKKKIRSRILAEAEARLQAITELEKSDVWTLKKKTKGIEVYTAKPPEGVHLDFIKGVGTINCTVEEFEKFLHSGVELLRQVDKMYNYGSQLGSIIPDTVVASHVCFKAPGRPIISDRDFTYITYYCNEKRCGMSFDTEYYAEDLDKLGIQRPAPNSGVVRAFLLGSAYFYRPVEGRSDQIQIVYVAQADVKGWIPTWVANLTAAQQAMNVQRIAKYFDKVHGKASGDDDDEEPETPAEQRAARAQHDVEEHDKEVKSESAKKKKKKSKKKKGKSESGAAAPVAVAGKQEDGDEDSGEGPEASEE